jgi:hypothetical protein
MAATCTVVFLNAKWYRDIPELGSPFTQVPVLCKK